MYIQARLEMYILQKSLNPKILKISLDDVKALHQRVYNEVKSWFTNLPRLPRVSFKACKCTCVDLQLNFSELTGSCREVAISGRNKWKVYGSVYGRKETSWLLQRGTHCREG